MSSNINVTQNKRIGLILSILAGLGGLTALLIYIEGRRHRKLTEDIATLDKQIKQLELLKLKNGNK